jgi:thioredoxin reductase (NADPH)
VFDFLSNVGGYESYALALLVIWGLFWFFGRAPGNATALVSDAEDAAPLSLHPIIDPAICIGCAACTNACPEGQILSMIGSKAELIDAASCIGHGACKTSCPVGAIELVFGTAKRGIDIPNVGPDFQTDVPGIYIAGELGGMGLVANAIEQGCQAIDAISKRERSSQANVLDVVIVGGGPAGFAASLAAKEKFLSAVTLEQDSLGGTVAHYPRGKLVMTRPARLPLFGKMQARRVQKEQLLGLWQSVMQKTGVQIRFGERVERVTPMPWGFEVTTQKECFSTRAVLLAMGRRGTPRKLDVPGEDLPKVVYSLADAEQYSGKHVLVVGGGNSAIEAARELAQQPGAKVTLSYRGQAFARLKPELAQWVTDAEAKRSLTVIRGSSVVSIGSHQVEINTQGQTTSLTNDAVIVCAGGVLPTALLEQVGVTIQTKYGTA